MDDVELDNERHKREEQERRAKRKAHRSTKSKSEAQAEKERKRKEHAQRILSAQQQGGSSGSGNKKPRSSSKKSPPKKPSSSSSTSNSSIFQSLFHQRAQGFLIDFHFRNAPPRPPVGPCFVGLGLEGELTDKWTKYKARNAVEKQYVWKLHSGNELYSVPLAVSAMDYEGCYTDPEKTKGGTATAAAVGEDEEEDDLMLGSENSAKQKAAAAAAAAAHVIPPLHPDDEALINWKGSLGDTAAEQLQQKRDRARAAARLAIAQGYGSLSAASLAAPRGAGTSTGGGATASSSTTGAGTPNTIKSLGSKVMKLKKKHHLHSRILDEQTPHFMKKTTYLTNTATSVHQFTSLAHTQEQRAKEVDRALAETSERYKKEDRIEMGFKEANSWDVQQVVVDDGDEANAAAAAAAANNDKKKKRRVHPSKKGVYPVWDLPLLPDVPTWGHTYAHVVLDHPPKSISNNAATPTKKKKGGKDGGNDNIVSAQQLQQAIVADVSKQTQNSRMACTVWVPDTSSAVSEEEKGGNDDNTNNNDDDGQQQQPPTKKAKKDESSEAYQAVQRYDLDVLPLRDPSGPQVHYVWMVDPSKKYIGYHPVGSRVQLSTGRPIVQDGGASRYDSKQTQAEDEVVVTNESLIYRRGMNVDERKDMEKRMAEVDVDMAEKYGLVEEDDLVNDDVVEKKGVSGMEMDDKKGDFSSDDSDAF